MLPGPAAAHAPLARSIAVASPTEVAVRMPGFGMVIGGVAESPAYACDALLGLSDTDVNAVVVARNDGSRLLGGPGKALRILASDGCTWRVPSGWPTEVGVVSATLVTARTDVCFAVSDEASPRLFRSDDSGESWRALAELGRGDAITGLVALSGTDDIHVYIARREGSATAMLQSIDGGETFVSRVYGGPLSLHGVRGGNPDVLWLSSPRPASADIAILRSAAGTTIAEERHRVRFFGGLALDPAGSTVWVADEAGALVRSDDDGDTFRAIEDTRAIACLAFIANRLWACTTGTNQQAALAYSDDRGASFTDVFAFADVAQLVTCGADAGVAATCAAAWAEWRADVLLPEDTDAGAVTDGGHAMDAGEHQATDANIDCSCDAVGAVRLAGHNNGATLVFLITSVALTMRCGRTRWWRRAPR